MKISFKIIIITFIFLLVSGSLFPLERLDDLSFVDTEITQVLKTISEAFGVTIIPDKDVQGRITRYIKNKTLDETLTLLLEPLGYIYEIKESVYFVKKKPAYTISYNEETGKFEQIIANNANLRELINEISIISKSTIVYDEILSTETISVNIFDKDLNEILEYIYKKDDYKLRQENGTFVFEKIIDASDLLDELDNPRNKASIKGDENDIELAVKNTPSNELIIRLFYQYKKKISLLSRKSVKIPYLHVDKVNFDELLSIICEHSGQSYTKIKDVYYIYDSLKSNQVNPYRVSKSYKLKNLTYKNFTLNVPSQIVPQTSYRLDSDNNIVMIYGSPEEVDLYYDYIKQIDDSMSDYKFRIFKLKNIDAKQVRKYLPDKYQKINISIFEDQNMFAAQLDEYDYNELVNYFKEIDVQTMKKYSYKFKYLDPEEVQKSMIPNNIKKDQVYLNKNDSSIVFEVQEEVKDDLFKFFDSIDVPQPVIRYQLLIVEYLDSDSFDLDWGVGLKTGDLDELGYEAGIFNDDGKTINANFDIPTTFGHYFTAFLQMQLINQNAKIQMSTEIFGISGETVNITNTKTIQYRDTITDSDSNETTPVYNSTTFGLNLEVKGRATSSDEVYIEVNARISDQIAKQGEGAAPDTSEKSVKNSIRTKTGKPIVLGGLTSQKENAEHNKIPLLGDIPFLGNLFKTHANNYENSEFIIYIIPFIQKSDDDLKNERREYIKSMYNYFIKS